MGKNFTAWWTSHFGPCAWHETPEHILQSGLSSGRICRKCQPRVLGEILRVATECNEWAKAAEVHRGLAEDWREASIESNCRLRDATGLLRAAHGLLGGRSKQKHLATRIQKWLEAQV